MNTTTMVPFVKWAGGKRQMLEQLCIRMPDTYNAYYEPFVGGGAMVLSLAPEKARINDINQELVHTYTEIRDHLGRASGEADGTGQGYLYSGILL